MGYQKIVQSGDFIEIYDYEKDLPSPKNRRTTRDRARVYKNVSRTFGNSRRSVRAFRRLVRANLGRHEAPALFTFTIYSVLSYSASFSLFTAFLSRLRREFGSAFRCIAVPEFQKRGAVHFHALMWGFAHEVAKERATRHFQRLWLYGFCDCLATDGHPRLAGYLAKYMSKAMCDLRLRGKKAYTSTRNVLRPVSVAGKTFPLEALIGVDNPPLREYSFNTQWLGRCHYKSYIQ